jgi:hypothetical protein
MFLHHIKVTSDDDDENNDFSIVKSPHCKIINEIVLDILNFNLNIGECLDLDGQSVMYKWKIFGIDLQ